MDDNKLDIAECVNDTCPWSGKPVSPDSLMLYRGRVVGFCNMGCRDKFRTATTLFDSLIEPTQSEVQSEVTSQNV